MTLIKYGHGPRLEFHSVSGSSGSLVKNLGSMNQFDDAGTEEKGSVGLSRCDSASWGWHQSA